MPLPSNIEMMFNSQYNGFRAARCASAVECHNLEAALRTEGVSYQTKIIKHKKRGNEFVVMLCSPEVTA